MMSHSRLETFMLFLGLASCGGGAERPAATADSTARPSASDSRAGMKLEAMAMLPGVRAHLDSLAQSPRMMRSAGSRYQAEIKNVVDAMNGDMARLGMHSDPAYEALADSVVRGSTALASASGAELERLVARQVEQLRRLSAVYETKVGTLK